MKMTFKELANRIYHFSYEGITTLFPAVKNPTSDTPEWEKFLFDQGTNEKQIIFQNRFLRVYGDLYTMYDNNEFTSNDDLRTDYFTNLLYFKKIINNAMNLNYKLVTTEFEPYDNYNKNSTITKNGGNTIVNEIEYGEQSSESRTGNQNNNSSLRNYTTGYENSTTESNKKYKDGNESTNTFGARTDSQNIASHTDSNTSTNNYTDTTIELTKGNIGVTTNATMGNENIEYAKKLNLWNMFVDLYLKEFSMGVYKCDC